jgi:Flp pilus assembly protein TadG
MPAAPTIIRRFRIAGDCAGTAAVEFALIAPVVATLFFGTFEIANLLLADMKLTAAAQAAADLVAHASSSPEYLGTAELADMSNAASQVMAPLPADTQLKLAYASVAYDTGGPVIRWHYETNGAAAISLAAIAKGADMAALGGTAIGSRDRLIVVDAQYAYTSPVSYLLARTWTLDESAFDRP